MGINLEKHEEFLKNLTITLEEDLERKEKVEAELKKIENLKYVIENLIEKSLKEFCMEFEVGCSVYYEAEIKSQNKIIINIGLDVYSELNYEEALNFLQKRIGITKRKIQLIDEQIVKNKAYVRLSKSILEKIKSEQKTSPK